MSEETVRMYSFLDPLHYESLERYAPSSEYRDLVETIVDASWQVKPRGFWTSCRPQDWNGLSHGWKIHVSSVPADAVQVLAAAAAIAHDSGVSFKFCSDPRMLRLSLSKGWSRFQSGKFIAIYPRDEAEFVRIAKRLNQATAHLSGPHILTDRAYPGSKSVFYRYGAHAPGHRVDAYGSRIPGYVLEHGQWYDDVRGARFRLPPGCNDPFATQAPAASGEAAPPTQVMLADRFRVKGAIKFNATGGIYYGEDTATGEDIVIREVRAHLGSQTSEAIEDPAHGIRREAKILRRLEDSSCVPRFVAIFEQGGNWFLVEEKLQAASLWDNATGFYYAQEGQSARSAFEKVSAAIRTIAAGLSAVHKRGVVLRDLTRSNVMFTAQGELKFIDFEFAYELDGTDPWVKGWTPGYASKEQLQSRKPSFKDDHYALGVLILDVLTFSAAGLELNRASIFEKLRQTLADLNFPSQLYDLVLGLTDQDADRRWDIQQAIACLDAMTPPAATDALFPTRQQLLEVPPPSPALCERIGTIVHGLNAHLDATSTLSRSDRLWPAGPQMFQTNPISLQFGATGIAWFKLRSTGRVDDAILDWIEHGAATRVCPPGLYSGLSGVALLLLQAGRVDRARSLLDNAGRDELTFSVPGLYFGCAGWGLVNLHFWRTLGDEKYLDDALKVGRWLLSHAQRSERGWHWLSNNKASLGLGDGQSGVALFLTYLAAASKDQAFAEAAGRALDFDFSHAIEVAGRATWQHYVGAGSSAQTSPHTRFGAAGVGVANARYYALTGESEYKRNAIECAYTVRSRVTNKIWHDSGNAGFGEFMLDMAQLLGEEGYRKLAFYHAEAIVPHAIELPTGIAFAGPAHYRICNEYSMGGAGIGLFFDRLLNAKPRLLMLDELLLD